MKNHMFKRLLALAVAMVMVLGMLPELHLHAHAEGEEEVIVPQSEDWCGNPLCSQEDNVHVTSCAQYVAPENPVCYCVEKCAEPNIWCDVCGFDYTQCGGTDRAVGYDTGWELEGTTLIVTGHLTALPEGVEYSKIEVHEGGNLDLGEATVTCDVDNDFGTISSGTFNTTDPVSNHSIISGGTFHADVNNEYGATISGGTFTKEVRNDGTISGGDFRSWIINKGTITGGTILYGTVSNKESGTISNAKFELGARLESGSKAPESVIHSVNGEDVALTYNAALPAALGDANAWYHGDTQVTDGTVPLNYTNYVGEYAVNTAAATNGTVSVPATAKYGQIVTVTATAFEGYVLDTVTVQQGETAVTVTDNAFTMPAGDVTVSAAFKLCEHDGSTHATATDNGDGTHHFVCSVCGGGDGEPHTIDSTTGKCEKCGAACPHSNFDSATGNCTDCETSVAIAKIETGGNTTYYQTADDLRTAVLESTDNQIVTLLADFETKEIFRFDANRTENILDLNRHTLTCDDQIVVGNCKLTITGTDSSKILFTGANSSSTDLSNIISVENEDSTIVVGSIVIQNGILRSVFGGVLDLTNATIPEAGLNVILYSDDYKSATYNVSDVLLLPADYYFFVDGKVVSSYSVETEGTVLKHTDHSYTYTDNGDGTHDATCSVCGKMVDNEAHTPGAEDYTVGTDGTHSFTCVCGTAVTEAHTYVDGTCACDLVKTYTVTLTAGYTGVKIVAVNGEDKEILPGGTFTVPHGQELKVKFVNTVSQKETGVHCDAWDEDWSPIDFNYDEATNTMTIPANEVNRDIFIDAYAYVSVQFNLHGGALTDEGKENLEESFGCTWVADTSTLKATYGFSSNRLPDYFQLDGHTLAGAKVDGSEEVVRQLEIRSDMTVDILWECDGTAILTPVPAKDATCTEAGNIAHYVCTCGKLYEDDAGTKELTAEDVKTDIDPTNHVENGFDSATGKCACGVELAVAKVTLSSEETTYYTSIIDAVAGANGSGNATITLLQNTTTGKRLDINQSATLDLNGNTLSCATNFSNDYDTMVAVTTDGAKLTIIDSIGGGKLDGTGTTFVLYLGDPSRQGVVTFTSSAQISGGTVSGGVRMRSGTSMTVSDGTLENNAALATIEMYSETTLNVSGGEILNTAFALGAISNTDGGTVIISGGTVNASGDYAVAIWTQNSGRVEISGGNIFGSQYDLRAYSEDTVELTGGTFPGGITVNGKTLNACLGDGFSYWAGNTMLTVADDAASITDKGEITIRATCNHSGNSNEATDNGDGTHSYTCTVCGTFVTETHSTTADGDEEATCVSKAYCSVCESYYGELGAHAPDATGKCTVDGCGYQYPAKVGDTFYESIHKALRAAEGISGCTLTLLDNITLTSSSRTASYVNKGTITLDLNGKTFSSNKGTLSVLGTVDLTIRDSIGGGKIVSTYSNAIYQTGGKLTIESGTFEGTLAGVFLSYDSTLIVKGGTFTGSRAMITGFGSNVKIDLTAIDPAGFTLKNNGSGTFAPKLPEGYGMVGSDGKLLSSLSAEQSATVHKHEYQYTDLGDGKHQQACSCGLTTGEPAAHSTTAEDDKAATCVAPAYCSVCDSEYGDVDKTNHDETVTYENGFCPYCDAFEPAELVDGVYQISNAGNLYWFADKVVSENAVYGSADAILTCDIRVNEGTMTEASTGARVWTPIGKVGFIDNKKVEYPYTGTFEGNGKTVSGLYFNDTSANFSVGLFSLVGEGGKVQNVGVADSYLCGTNTVGAVAGTNFGTVTNCYNTGTVSGTSSVGGVVGYNTGTVTGCYNTGTVSGESSVGGVVGNNIVRSGEVYYTPIVTDCHNSGTVSGEDEVGGVVGHSSGDSRHKGIVTGCYNTGTVSGTTYVGGVVGSGNASNCYNTGTVSGTSDVGGVVGNCMGEASVMGCYNTGTVSGESNVGGVAGYLMGKAILVGCYNTGTVSGESNVGGVVGWNQATCTNCYFDSTVYTGNAIGDDSGTATDVEGKTTEQFASGEVAYLLSQGEKGDIWGQTIGTDPAPIFSDAKVYYGYTSCGDTEAGYTNEEATEEKPAHTQQPAYTDNHDGTHSAVYPCCGTTVTEDHTMDTATGKCVCGLEMAEASVTMGFAGGIAGDGITTYYETLSEAISNVSTATADDNATVTLLKDNNAGQTVYGGVFTLNLNGKTLSSVQAKTALNIYNATVTITDTLGGGEITGQAVGVNAQSSTLTIINTAITITEATGHGVYTSNCAVTIEGGTISGASQGVSADSGNLTIIDAEITGSGKSSHGVDANHCAAVTIEGGSISGEYIGVNAYDSNLTIKNAEVTCSGESGYGVNANKCPEVTIEGGTISGGYIGVYAYGGNLTIKNAEVTCSDESGYGVYASECPEVTIEGSTITTAGEYSTGVYAYKCPEATIEGGKISGGQDGVNAYLGSLTIQKAEITATGEYGNGVYAEKATLTVTNAAITATGKSGCGVQVSECPEVTIKGGSISGTGMGVYVLDSSLTIQEMTITATGANGYSVYAEGGTLKITDATVTATGEFGDGVVADGCTEVVIEGGKITASGTEGRGVDVVACTLTIQDCSVTGGSVGVVAYDGSSVSLENCTVTATEAVSSRESEIRISGGSVTGSSYDLVGNVKLMLPASGTGTTFPGGITVTDADLDSILGEGAAYWQGSRMIVPGDGQREYTLGDVTVKKACDHVGSQHTTATDNHDGAHIYDCTLCGISIVEEHSFENDAHKCICGKVETFTVYWASAEFLGLETGTSTFGQDFVQTITVPENTHLRIDDVYLRSDSSIHINYTYENGVLTIAAEDLPAGDIEVLCDHYVEVTFCANGGVIKPHDGYPEPGDTGFAEDGSYWIQKFAVGLEINNFANAEMSRTGYTFVEWRDASGKLYPMNVPGRVEPYILATEDVTLYAQWQCNHTIGGVEFRDNGDGTHNGYCGECGEPLGNYVERPHAYDETTHQCACGVIEIFAYQVETYTMDAYGNYGEPETEEKSAPYGTQVNATPNSGAEGFYLDTEHENSLLTATVPANDDLVLKVYIGRNQYPITWDLNGGGTYGNDLPESKYFGISQLTVFDKFVKEGHTFSHLEDASGSRYVDASPNSDCRRFYDVDMPAGGLTLKAIWSVNAYALHVQDQTLDVDYGTALDAALSGITPEKTGHTFTGWTYYYLDDEGVEQPYTGTTMPASDLYAQSVFTPIKYNITWILNGCTVNTEIGKELPETLPYTGNTDTHRLLVALDEPAGYKLEGFRDGNGNKLSYSLGNGYLFLPVTGDMIVEAVIEPKSYMATWETGDGGSYEKEFKYGETITIPENEFFPDTFRKAGYTLTGWEGYTEGMTMPIDGVTFTAKWQINPASLAVTSAPYTGQPHAPTVTVEGLTEGEDFTVSYPEDMTNVGEKVITVTGVLGGETTVTYAIEKAPAPAITFPTVLNAITYGQQLQEAKLSFYENELGRFDWTAPIGVPGSAGVHDYALDFYPADLRNYDWEACNWETHGATWIASRNALCAMGRVTVNRVASIMETAPTEKTLTYNGQPQELVTAGSVVGGTLQYSVNGGEWSEAVPTASEAGYYQISYQVVGNSNYIGIGASALPMVQIQQATLTVTAQDHTITYGDTPSNNGITYDGFVNGETAAVLGGTVAYTYNYAQYGNVGIYRITPAGLTSDNYRIIFADGTLTVYPKAIPVKADALSKIYGQADPELTYQADGLVNGDKLTGELKREAGENIGCYAIGQNTLTAGNNYTVVYTGAELTIEAKAIAEADVKLNGSLTYTGQEQAQPITVTEGITYEVTGNKATNAGTYALNVKGTGNYTGTVTKTWTIAKAAQAIQAAQNVNLTCKQTHPLAPEAESEITFVSSDPSVVTVDESGKLTALKPGTATITLTAAENANYLQARKTIAVTVSHDYTGVVTAPTCEDKGYTTYTCVCGHSYVADYVDATGHDYRGVITTQPDCENEGVKTFTCANDKSHTYTEKVAATGHSPKAAVEENRVEATCTEKGSYELATYCGTCGKELGRTQHEIPAKGHSFGSWTVVKAATCTEKGLERRDCSNCDHYETRLTAALGHVYQDPMDPSCQVCGERREVYVASIPMLRLYNPATGEHHYTGSAEERDTLVSLGWNYEGVAWNAPVEFGDPVCRYYNPNTGDHHYTMCGVEGENLIAEGWIYEGVAWNSASPEHLPIYRLYNPNAEIGTHHYTGSEIERDNLVEAGWNYEGIAWYALLY